MAQNWGGMLFNSFIFLLAFLPVTYAVFWLLRSAQSRYVWLAVTSYIFYGYWNPRFCLLMAFSTLVSYSAGLGFLAYHSPRARRLCLVVPISVDLALLGFFKYANFAFEIARTAGKLLGASFDLPMLDIVLPVGISFYTFHTITYIVDSYRGTIRPTRNLFEFAAYVSLFSQLVAGPIVRFRQIEEDLENLGSANRRHWLPLGVSFFVIGLVEKVVIADTLAAYADPTLLRYQSLGTLSAWTAMLAYTLQLYYDFCGYSDMAVGLGYLFGLRIPQNFNSPYQALDPSDFWRRWHISLSTCLRDYLYIPLGGSRHGTWVTYRNLLITMLLGGLWHGANWTFVVWGGYHGLLLVAYRQWSSQWNAVPVIVRRCAMFVLVMIGWVLFRSTDFKMATSVLATMFSATAGCADDQLGSSAWCLVAAALWAVVGPNAFDVLSDFRWKRRYGYGLAVALGVCIAVMARGRASPFLYFQF